MSKLGSLAQREMVLGESLPVDRTSVANAGVPLSLSGLPKAAVRQVACGGTFTLILLSALEHRALQLGSSPSANTRATHAVNGQVRMLGNSPMGPAPVPIRDFVVQVAAGADHMACITGSRPLSQPPSILAGAAHCTGLMRRPPRNTDEEVANLYTWGENTHGQLGNGSTTRELVPKKVTTLRFHCIQVSCGNKFTIAITDTGRFVGLRTSARRAG